MVSGGVLCLVVVGGGGGGGGRGWNERDWRRVGRVSVNACPNPIKHTSSSFLTRSVPGHLLLLPNNNNGHDNNSG